MSVAELFRIDRTIDLAASPERVWRALTSAPELTAWFHVAIEGDIAIGEEIWMTSTHPDHGNARFKVRIVELSSPRRVVWQWHPGEFDPNVDYSREAETTVTFELEATSSGTRLTVSETGFDRVTLARRAKVYGDNAKGWAEVLVWLERYVEDAR